MAFFVPKQHATLFEDVERRFRLLVARGVITGIPEAQLSKWLVNFVSEEDEYLAARLLEHLTFRSEEMVRSAILHILESILPCELRRLKVVSPHSVDEFVESLRAGNASTNPVRFVEVDAAHESTPGKSGSVVIREVRRLGRVHKTLTCECADLGKLPSSVKALIFVDDMLGSGTQFKKFAEHHKLEQHSKRFKMLYCPLAAHTDGLAALAKVAPWLQLLPVEVFGNQHSFYRADAKDPTLWAVDRTNTVADVKAHMASLSERGRFSTSSYSLDLLIGFQHATPNNTLAVMYASTPHWHHLLTR